ncbi:MAG: glycosyltransferase family 2 protein [Chloroflexota bacterium]|nr:glycosyltransferase family 2 protein [Chloroflexota bacterium]
MTLPVQDSLDVSIVIPVYNECEAISRVLDDLVATMEPLDWSYEIVAVDDGSTDDSRDICRARPGVVLATHGHNRGPGAARTTGVRRAKGRYVVMIDADGTYPVDAIPTMLRMLNDCDMVIGAREREMGTLKWIRSAAKNFIKNLASYLTRTDIPDLNSGLRAMKRDLVLEFLPILPTTHSWVSTITLAFLSNGYVVKWVPITYRKRIGTSTFHPIVDTYNYLSLVIRAMMYFDPLRVFLPLSLAMLLIGIGKAIYDIFAYDFHFAPSTLMIIFTTLQVGAIGLLADLIVRRSKL